MKKYCICILLALAAVCMAGTACSQQAPVTDKSPSNDVQDGDVYSNTKYKFSITFPSGWKQQTGDGPNVVRTAVNTISGETIAIVVQELPSYLTALPADIEKMVKLDEIQSVFNKEYPDFEITDHGIVYIAGEKTIWYKTIATYTIQDKKVKATLLTYQFLHKGVMYSITTGEGEEALRSITSFVFEDN